MLDFDDTEDPAHGAQEQVRYDGYYGGYCFLPLHIYEGLSGRLITTIFKAKRLSSAQFASQMLGSNGHDWKRGRLLERSKLFKSHGSNQWLTSKIELLMDRQEC